MTWVLAKQHIVYYTEAVNLDLYVCLAIKECLVLHILQRLPRGLVFAVLPVPVV